MRKAIPFINSPGTGTRLFIWLVFVSFIIAVGLQFYITLSTVNSGRTLGGVLLQLFSYFTILSNILCGASLAAILLSNGNPSFFNNNKVLTALTTYITIVGLVYNLVLRFLWAPQGWSMVADELLHSVNPLLYIIFWFAAVPKAGIKHTDVFTWLWWPFFYLLFILIRGAITGLYPYPFIDVMQLGYPRVLVNAAILILVFMVFGYLYTFMATRLAGKSQKA